MPIWFNYSPLAAGITRYVDDGKRDLCKATISIVDVGDFEVALVGTRTSVELIRVATLNSDGKLTPTQSETIGKLMDHMISVLRITYDQDVARLSWNDQTIGVGAHDKDGQPNLSIDISDVTPPRPEYDFENVARVFAGSTKIRHLMKLLSDTQLLSLPLQYRYLSLYKIFELEFKFGGKWNGLDALLAPYQEQYGALKISDRALRNIIHELRDKCAHIKTGSNDDLGIVGLDHADTKIVSALMPLLINIIANYISEKHAYLKIVVSEPPVASRTA
jgi:hypothetical protein